MLAAVVIAVTVARPASAEGEPSVSASSRRPGLIDVGVRTAYAWPLGSFDAGTHAADVSYGGIPLALDATVRIPSASGWSVAVGGLLAYAPTIPKLCTSTSECTASIGHDTELVALARVRAPHLAFVLPEVEIGTGWAWSSRSLVDRDFTSTRKWTGPVLLRAALVPSLSLGARTRFGVVLGGSVARSTAFALEAPGVTWRGLDGARLHGTIDVGFRIAIDFGN